MMKNKAQVKAHNYNALKTVNSMSKGINNQLSTYQLYSTCISCLLWGLSVSQNGCHRDGTSF